MVKLRKYDWLQPLSGLRFSEFVQEHMSLSRRQGAQAVDQMPELSDILRQGLIFTSQRNGARHVGITVISTLDVLGNTPRADRTTAIAF